MLDFAVPINTKELELIKIPLNELALELRLEKGYQASGKAARSLIRGDGLTVVLVALKQGAGLSEHHAPGHSVVTVLEGSILFSGPNGADQHQLLAHDCVVFPAGLPHAVECTQDTLMQIVIGCRLQDNFK